MARSQRRTALLYDAPLSTPEDIALVKGMLLFFDDIAVFSTPAHPSRPPPPDLRLCGALVDRELLHFVAPREVVRSQTEVVIRATLHRTVMEKADHWLAAASAGDWDLEVPRLQGRFSAGGLVKLSEASSGAGLVRSTEASGPDAGLVKATDSSSSRASGSLDLFKLLAQDGLLLPDESRHEESIVYPGIASVANTILAQAVRAASSEQGWLLEPVATRRDEAKVFTAILEDAVQNVRGRDVVTSDLSPVALDFSRVRLDEVLDFRARHRREFRAYVLALQAFLASAPTSGDVADRRAALAAEAERLRGLQLRRWPKLGAGASLGIIGAAWTLAGGDLLGALIGVAGSQLLPVGTTPASAYTYLLRADTEPEPTSLPAPVIPALPSG